MDRERFDDIFQQLSFGTKTTRNAYRPSGDENKLPLRQLPKEEKRRKLKPKSVSNEDEGIKLFSNSTVTIESATKREAEKAFETTDEDRVLKIRQLNQIYTWGAEQIPDPPGLAGTAFNNIKNADFQEPSAVQMQSIPILLNRQNLLANAPTGSGKTLAFVLPIIKLLLDKPTKRVNAVILSPTNVLAQQIYVQFLKFANNLPIRVALLEPGVLIDDANIIVTTPYKFIYSLKKENLSTKDLSKLSWLILDEADRLFETTEGDRNFRLQFEEVCKTCKGPQTNLAFFSATFSFELEHWCKENLNDPAMLCIGHRNSANAAVKQELLFTSDENGKLFALEQLLSSGFQPPALSKERAGTLCVELQARCPNIPIRLISSELTNSARDKILDKFRTGQVWVLISTEILGRGLDIPNVNLVINFDLPTSVISYIHRVGRTGRAGRQGKAVTFYTYQDMSLIHPIATVINQAGFEVPEYILKLEKLTKKQRKYLLKHAPKRKNIGSIHRWNSVKKSAMKDRVIKRDPALLHKRKRHKAKSKTGEASPDKNNAATSKQSKRSEKLNKSVVASPKSKKLKKPIKSDPASASKPKKTLKLKV
ncbi:hypothetical protein M3Y97_00395100 [Aphelenchoides bicaudatus]|nr:hypothetical protein M3Y97_00395100 [Aphelenchoides bicaudatus]